MSIASELTNLESNIGDAYDAVNDMSGIIPQHKNMANLDQAIRTIPQSQGATYTAGNGINIDANNEISIDTTVVAEVADLPSDMTGATSQIAGAHGLVPAPAAGDENKVLKGDGTWSPQFSGIPSLDTNNTIANYGTVSSTTTVTIPADGFLVGKGVTTGANQNAWVSLGGAPLGGICYSTVGAMMQVGYCIPVKANDSITFEMSGGGQHENVVIYGWRI